MHRLLLVRVAIAVSACAGPGALPSADALRARSMAHPDDVGTLRLLAARSSPRGAWAPRTTRRSPAARERQPPRRPLIASSTPGCVELAARRAG